MSEKAIKLDISNDMTWPAFYCWQCEKKFQIYRRNTFLVMSHDRFLRRMLSWRITVTGVRHIRQKWHRLCLIHGCINQRMN